MIAVVTQKQSIKIAIPATSYKTGSTSPKTSSKFDTGNTTNTVIADINVTVYRTLFALGQWLNLTSYAEDLRGSQAITCYNAVQRFCMT